jgi:hypothetical protein
MTAPKQRVGSMRWVIESTPDNINSSNEFIPEATITILGRRMRNANVALAYFDENDVRIRTVIIEKLGVPISPEMRRIMDFEFGSDDDDAEVATSA